MRLTRYATRTRDLFIELTFPKFLAQIESIMDTPGRELETRDIAGTVSGAAIRSAGVDPKTNQDQGDMMPVGTKQSRVIYVLNSIFTLWPKIVASCGLKEEGGRVSSRISLEDTAASMRWMEIPAGKVQIGHFECSKLPESLDDLKSQVEYQDELRDNTLAVACWFTGLEVSPSLAPGTARRRVKVSFEVENPEWSWLYASCSPLGSYGHDRVQYPVSCLSKGFWLHLYPRGSVILLSGTCRWAQWFVFEATGWIALSLDAASRCSSLLESHRLQLPPDSSFID